MHIIIIYNINKKSHIWYTFTQQTLSDAQLLQSLKLESFPHLKNLENVQIDALDLLVLLYYYLYYCITNCITII